MSLKHTVRDFAEQLRTQTRLGGGPRERLKSPVSELIKSLGAAKGLRVHSTREFRIIEVGCPDIAIYVDESVVGVVELKAPERSIDPKTFRDHDRRRWERYQNLSNLIYTNGNEWRLYQGDSTLEEKSSVSLGAGIVHGTIPDDPISLARLDELVESFLRHSPLVPRSPRELAAVLAPRCRLLRDAVRNASPSPARR